MKQRGSDRVLIRQYRKVVLALSCRLDPLEEGRLMVLRLPPRRVKLPAPQSALLPVVPEGYPDERLHAYGDLLAWSRGHLYSALPQLHSALLELADLANNAGHQLLWCMAPHTSAFKVRRRPASCMLLGPPQCFSLRKLSRGVVSTGIRRIMNRRY